MRKRTGFNTKRRLAGKGACSDTECRGWATSAIYEGSSEHKRTPLPGSRHVHPRPAKTFCDDAGVATVSKAEAMLREGLRRGVVSEQRRPVGGWPQNVWFVDERGEVFEAQLGNVESGCYHGYPLQPEDPFRQRVLAAWEET